MRAKRAKSRMRMNRMRQTRAMVPLKAERGMMARARAKVRGLEPL